MPFKRSVCLYFFGHLHGNLIEGLIHRVALFISIILIYGLIALKRFPWNLPLPPRKAGGGG